MQQIDLDKYLKKLNIDINTQESPLTLIENIQKKHLETFSFNNIAVLLKNEISIKIEDIVEKIVTQNQGGYCFEHNALMFKVLKDLGFNVRLLIGRVVNNTDKDVPRTHRITLLEHEDKKYLIDVGFGPLCIQKPMQLDKSYLDTDAYRVVQNSEGSYQLEKLTNKGYFILYKFDLETYTHADCVMGNFYSSHYKDAVFVNNFVLSLITSELTLSLRNHTLHRIYKNKTTEVVNISSVKQLCTIINNEFKISIDEEKCEKIFHLHT